MARRAPLLLLLAIVVAGGALRAERAAHPRPGLYADETAYARAAVELAEGTYTQTHYPPGTPALFAVAYALGGRADSPALDIPGAYWAQALVGTALIATTFALAALIANAWAGVAAAAVVAFERLFVVRTDRLLSEPLAALLLVAGFAALAWALRGDSPLRRRRLALAGALFGALLLTRANFLVAAVAVTALVAVLVARRHGPRCALAAAAAFAVPALVVVAPWCLWASHWEGRFVPVASGGGSSLFIGTYLPGDGSTYGAKRALAGELWRRRPGLRGTPAYRLRAKLVLDLVAARHPGLDRDAALTREARRNVARYARRQPAAFAGLLLSKPRRLWWGYSEGQRRAPPAAWATAHRVLLVAALLLLGAGVALTRRPILLAAALVLAAVTAQHVVLLALPRYAVPLLPVLYASAAGAAALLQERQRSLR